MGACFSLVCPSSAARGMQSEQADLSQKLYGPDAVGVHSSVNSPPIASFLIIHHHPTLNSLVVEPRLKNNSTKLTVTHFSSEENWKVTKQPTVCNPVIHQLPDQKQHKGENGVSLTQRKAEFVRQCISTEHSETSPHNPGWNIVSMTI